MFDPLTELPVLEKWFEENPHPTWLQVISYAGIVISFESITFLMISAIEI